MLIKQSTTYTRTFFMVDASDHVSPKTGLTVTVTISKAGGSFGAAGGTVTEVANGWYKIALTTTDTNTVGDLSYHCTATAADDTDFSDQVTAGDLASLDAAITSRSTYAGADTSGTTTLLSRLGSPIGASISADVAAVKAVLPASAAVGTSGGLPTTDADNSVKIQTPVKRNSPLTTFMFLMVDDSAGLPATGLTVSASRSLDGAAFASCVNSPTEIGNGVYMISLADSDLNATCSTLFLSATGARSLVLSLLTMP